MALNVVNALLLAFIQGSAETEPTLAPCGSWPEMCLLLSCALARCTKLSTEVSKESKVSVSKQEKQMGRGKNKGCGFSSERRKK